jgi:hypothetical protein
LSIGFIDHRRARGASYARWLSVLVAVVITVTGVLVSPRRSLAIDYRLEIITGSFTLRAGERIIINVSAPNAPAVESLLTDPATTAVVRVSAPLATRSAVADIVAGGDFVGESESVLNGPVFRGLTLNDAPAYQLNVPTAVAARPGVVRLRSEGLRAMRITVTGESGIVAEAVSFLNVVLPRTYTALPVYFVADADGAPTLQSDGSTRVGEIERQRLRNLRDLIYRKPPGTPLGIRVRPELIDGLIRSGTEDDQVLLADLIARLPDNDVLVGTFRPTSVASYAAANLKSQFEAQLLRGETVLDAVNGPNISSRAVWVTNEPIDAGGVDLLRGFGVTNVVTVGSGVQFFGPDTDHSRPYALRSETNGVVVSLADSRYSDLLDRPIGTAHESAVALAAELIAQREQIIDSAVGVAALNTRHVVLSSAAGIPREPLITITLLRLLRTAPQVSLRRTTELAPTLEGLARIQPPNAPLVDVAAIQSRTNQAIAAIESVRDVVSANEGLADRWTALVDVANDTSINETARDEYLRAVLDQVDSVKNAVTLPTSSFTFGSRESDMRLSLLNESDYTLTMRLQVSSPTGKMTFTPNLLDVVLSANGQEEIVIAASARSNGLIPVELVLTSPSGTVLDVTEVRIRVNAIAGLGRGVSGLFLVLLGAWWVIHARRTMKKRQAKEHPTLRSQA